MHMVHKRVHMYQICMYHVYIVSQYSFQTGFNCVFCYTKRKIKEATDYVDKWCYIYGNC